MLVKWSPYNELATVQREMNNLLDGLWNRKRSEATGFGSFLPPVDIRETKTEYVVELDLPGIDQKDISVGLENDVLTVRGERKIEQEKNDECMACSERPYGTFIRSFSLPGTADSERVGATYKNGVLTISIPKREEAKPKSIKVEVK
jgi:HSP20 family protein